MGCIVNLAGNIGLEYGDDVPAQDLISPPAFSDMALEPTTFQNLKGPDDVRALFEKIDIKLDDSVFYAVFGDARPVGDKVSINSFRDALNEYLDACGQGCEGDWKAAHGI